MMKMILPAALLLATAMGALTFKNMRDGRRKNIVIYYKPGNLENEIHVELTPYKSTPGTASNCLTWRHTDTGSTLLLWKCGKLQINLCQVTHGDPSETLHTRVSDDQNLSSKENKPWVRARREGSIWEKDHVQVMLFTRAGFYD